jgi:hypothetical protein
MKNIKPSFLKTGMILSPVFLQQKHFQDHLLLNGTGKSPQKNKLALYK